MSLYSNQGPCGSGLQSPINLTQATASTRDISINLSFDTPDVSNVKITNIQGIGMGIQSSTYGAFGSCNFRGDTYSSQGVGISYPSQHTIEGSQKDGEVFALFMSPSRKMLVVSSLFTANSNQTDSYEFFKKVVPSLVGVDTNKGVSDAVVSGWNVSMMIPSSTEYFTYTGSTIIANCTQCEWVVFKNTINMDPDDFAQLKRLLPKAGKSRDIQGIGTREVFFNSTTSVAGTMPNDGKLYMNVRIPKGASLTPAKKVDLKTPPKIDVNAPVPKTTFQATAESIGIHMENSGGFYIVLQWLVVAAAVFLTGWYVMTNSSDFTIKGSNTKSVSEFIINFIIIPIRDFCIRLPPILWYFFVTRPYELILYLANFVPWLTALRAEKTALLTANTSLETIDTVSATAKDTIKESVPKIKALVEGTLDKAISDIKVSSNPLQGASQSILDLANRPKQ